MALDPHKIGKDNNLLWLQVPQQGDLSILYQPELDKPSFCEAVINLLYGPDPYFLLNALPLGKT
jgi:hypothetical protein